MKLNIAFVLSLLTALPQVIAEAKELGTDVEGLFKKHTANQPAPTVHDAVGALENVTNTLAPILTETVQEVAPQHTAAVSAGVHTAQTVIAAVDQATAE